MNKSLLVLLLAFIYFPINAQDTIKIKAKETFIYQGQEAKISTWFIYYKKGIFYLCNLPGINSVEAKKWFEKRIDSQNILKARLGGMQYETLNFSKDNDKSQQISFYYKKVDKDIELISTTDGGKYTFIRM